MLRDDELESVLQLFRGASLILERPDVVFRVEMCGHVNLFGRIVLDVLARRFENLHEHFLGASVLLLYTEVGVAARFGGAFAV